MHLSTAHYRKTKLSISIDYYFIKLAFDTESWKFKFYQKIKQKMYLALIWRLRLLTCGKWVGCVVATLMYCSWPDPAGDAFRCTSCGWCCDGEWFCAWAINWFCWCDCDWCACMMGIFISGWRWICDGNSGGNIFSNSMNEIWVCFSFLFDGLRENSVVACKFTINWWCFWLGL